MENDLIRRRDIEAVIIADSYGRYCPPEPVDPYSWALSFVRDIPAVDAVEVCRCGQCEFTETDCADAIYCQRWDRWEMPPDGYCAWGQSREDGDA